MLIRNFGFVLDVMTLLMAMGHYMHIWWLHGLSFHLIDAVLFLNLRVRKHNFPPCAMSFGSQLAVFRLYSLLFHVVLF